MSKDFKDFKNQLIQMLDTREGFDSEWYQEWYIEFRQSIYTDVEEFASIWFGDVSFDTHYYRLKKNFNHS